MAYLNFTSTVPARRRERAVRQTGDHQRGQKTYSGVAIQLFDPAGNVSCRTFTVTATRSRCRPRCITAATQLAEQLENLRGLRGLKR